ncbi:MAG: ABC transporter substrate-binding protein [Clostridia bacterium]|nr:ABC transporter substrate-binding protein [Clostridia bacterium]
MKKKILSAVMAAIVVVLAVLLASCGEVKDDVTIRVAVLKGPTGMGMAKLIDDKENEKTDLNYEFTIASTPTEVLPEVLAGRVEIAAVPVNVAAMLYNKGADISVVAVNTLSVLYVIEKGNTVQSLSDLSGKTVYATGKGSTPEYIINFVLENAGIADKVNVIYLSEGSDVASNVVAEKDGVTIGILPEPAVSSALMKDTSGEVRVALDISKEWDKYSDTPIVQGVIVMSNTFLSKHKAAAERFLTEYKASTDYVNANVDEAAAMIENYQIVPKAAIAKKAIPNCNICCYTGAEMKTMVGDMLKVLYDANPASVGGQLPNEKIYYVK